MRLENERAALKELSLGSIKNIFALPKKESDTDLPKQGLWQEEAISNSCVIPKEIETRELKQVHETLRETEEVISEDESENETRSKKCRWNDYVGTVLAVGSTLVMAPISTATATAGIVGAHIPKVGPYIALPWLIFSAGITMFPAELIQKAFRVDEECAENICKNFIEKYKNLKQAN